jgi:hypothetical protein
MLAVVRSGLFVRDWRCRVRRLPTRGGRCFALRLNTRFKSDIDDVQDVLDRPVAGGRRSRVEGVVRRWSNADGSCGRSSATRGGARRAAGASAPVHPFDRGRKGASRGGADRCATSDHERCAEVGSIRGTIGRRACSATQRALIRTVSIALRRRTVTASSSWMAVAWPLSRGEVRRGWFSFGSGRPRERQATSAPPEQRGRTS